MKIIKRVNQPFIKDSDFVIIPKPFKNELLTSWFSRTAYAHYTHPICFYHLHFGYENRRQLRNNFDVVINDQNIKDLYIKSNSKVDIYALTIKSFSGYLQEKYLHRTSNRFIVPLRFCPLCLKDEPIPYFKKEWNIAFATVCLKHQCYLEDKCPKCNRHLSLLKMYKDENDYTHCYYCGYDLKSIKPKLVEPNNLKGIEASKHLIDILYSGYKQFKNDVVYSFCYFDAITQLKKLILINKKNKFINQDPLYRFLKKYEKCNIKHNIPIHQQLSITEQFAFFGIIESLFDSYPSNFKSYIVANKLTHWDMMRHIKYKSFWYQNLVNNITPRYVAFADITSKLEIESAKKYLKKKNMPITKANLSKLFGSINHIAHQNTL